MSVSRVKFKDGSEVWKEGGWWLARKSGGNVCWFECCEDAVKFLRYYA